MRNELLKGLTQEQIEKVKASNDPNELLKLAKAEGVELTAEQLGAISGGGVCPEDSSRDEPKSPM